METSASFEAGSVPLLYHTNTDERGGHFRPDGLFFSAMRQFLQLYRSPDRELSVIGMTGFGLVTSVLAKSTTDDQFVRHSALLFWSLVGIGMGYGRRSLLAGISHSGLRLARIEERKLNEVLARLSTNMISRLVDIRACARASGRPALHTADAVDARVHASRACGGVRLAERERM